LINISKINNLLPDLEKQPVMNSSQKHKHDGKGKSVRIFLDTKGRKGKSVTIISGLQHNPKTMEDIARILKQHCGAGGTVKDGNIEIQGDNRERVAEKLREIKYIVNL
jgi:translation initiation factor 1